MLDQLSGVRVISLNHFLLGPVGTQYLADLGADVISVEPLEGAFQRNWSGANKFVDGQSMLFLAGNRNKKSLALDLKSSGGKDVLGRLIAGADVLAENFRPGVMKRLGFSSDELLQQYPGLVYAAASGFGPDGPYAERPGQDLLVQAMSGLAKVTGEKGAARGVGVSAADHHGAALFALGIISALFRKQRTGKGGRVDVSLLSAAIDLQVESFTAYMNGVVPEHVHQPRNGAGWSFAAPYGIYATKDGELAISLGDISFLAKALDRPALNEFDANAQHARRDEITAIVAEAFKAETTAHWVNKLMAEGVWHTIVNDYADVLEDPQVVHNGSFVTTVGSAGKPIYLVNHPIRYDGVSASVAMPPQPLGTHTDEILRSIGYSEAEISDLMASGAVGRAAVTQAAE